MSVNKQARVERRQRLRDLARETGGMVCAAAERRSGDLAAAVARCGLEAPVSVDAAERRLGEF